MAQDQQAYKFSMFDNSYDYGTSAPKFEPEYEPEQPEKKKNPKKAKSNKVSKSLKAETRASHIKAVKLFASIIAVAAVFSSVLFLNAACDEKATEIIKTKDAIDVAMSDNVRLTSALEGMVSIDKVEDYAENVLGMVKLEEYKITYFNTGSEDAVVVSGGKSYASNGLMAKFEELAEYFSK